MAVVEVLTYEVTPGRLEEFLADVRQLERVLARVDVGLTGMRVLRSMVAGADSGRVALWFENADLVSWGQSLEAEIGDPDKQAIDERWRREGSPVTLVHRMLLRDVPL